MTRIEDDEDEEFLHYLRGIEENQRYAGTRFNRSGTMPDSEEQYLNEKSAVRTLQECIPHLSGELSKPKSDPPDVVISNSNNEVIGVEVTELVNEEAIRANFRYYETRNLEDFRYTNFLSDEGVKFFNEKINFIVARKSKKLKSAYASKQYQKLVLLIATDEHMLGEDIVTKMIGDNYWTSIVFDEIYLLLSYKPVVDGKGYYPCFRLDTERSS